MDNKTHPPTWGMSTVRLFLLLRFSSSMMPLSLRLSSALQLAVRAGMRNLPVLHGLTEFVGLIIEQSSIYFTTL